MDYASGVPDLSFHLLNEITDGFSPDRILGIGAFGKVYMGVQKDGKQIAVKVLHDMIALDDEKFINEYNNLTKLKHHNVVRLVGYCKENRKKCVYHEGRLVEADEIKRALCFEYLNNGSLDKYLVDEHHGQDWNTRYVIIKGICEGLKYLHEDLEAPMYHLDLKPANILLDGNMEPKIADFGLSRLFGEERTRITKSFIGTFGYLPPEYIDRNIISNKLDIFSLGVILIKIMAGRSGYDKCFDMHPQQFIQLVQENWRIRLQKPTDFEEVKKCIEIALRCVEVDRHRRPTIGEIVHNLSETETVIHNSFPVVPHSLRNDPVASDHNENVPDFLQKEQGNDSGPSLLHAPPVLAIVNESEESIPFGVPLPKLWRGGLAPLSRFFCFLRGTPLSRLTASSRLVADQEGGSSSGSGANIQLCFLSRLMTPIYTEENIIAEGNKAIRIGIFEGDKMITAGLLSKLKVEMLVLQGDFNNDREIWTDEQFKTHIVQGRYGQGFVLEGDCGVCLDNGEASFGRIRFKEGSYMTRSRKFIIAARVCLSEKINVRVQEAVLKAVIVRHRTTYGKKHPPNLYDGVDCLEGVSEYQTLQNMLHKANIWTVQDFLMALIKDENKLCNEVLRLKKEHSSFRAMVEHATECTLGDDQIDRAKKDGTWDKLMDV